VTVPPVMVNVPLATPLLPPIPAPNNFPVAFSVPVLCAVMVSDAFFAGSFGWLESPGTSSPAQSFPLFSVFVPSSVRLAATPIDMENAQVLSMPKTSIFTFRSEMSVVPSVTETVFVTAIPLSFCVII